MAGNNFQCGVFGSSSVTTCPSERNARTTAAPERSETSRSALGPPAVQAEADKAKGLAQAAIIEAQGKATAEATRLKAEAFQKYNEAAVIELLVKVLPELAGKIAEPLSKTEKMVIINSGSGPGGGASKLTGDVTQIIAQLPPVLAPQHWR